jgi:hypothetical protein
MQASHNSTLEFYSNGREKDRQTVANIKPSVMQNLLDEVEKLEKMTSVITQPRRDQLPNTKINEVRAAVFGGTAKVDPARWLQLNEQKQHELKEQLTMMRDTLLTVARQDEQKTPGYFTDNETASTSAIIWLAIFGFIFAATLLSLIR